MPEKAFIGLVHDIEKAFPPGLSPNHTRGALQGEGVYAACRARADDNYLYSLNAQTCVITTLYNPETKAGVVLHIDHNIRHLVDEAIDAALDKLGGGAVRSTMSGGVWLGGGEPIGDVVKEALNQRGIDPKWDEWTFSPCTQHNYGVILNLENGQVVTFDHSINAVSRFQDPLLREAGYGGASLPVHQRAIKFMDRMRAPAVAEINGKLAFVNDTNSSTQVTRDAIEASRIVLHDVSGDAWQR